MPRTASRGLSAALGVAVISTPAAAQTGAVSSGTTAAAIVFTVAVGVVIADTFTGTDLTGTITDMAAGAFGRASSIATSLVPGSPVSGATDSARDTGSGIRRFFTSRSGILVVVLAVIVGAAAAGVGEIERSSTLPLFVAVELVAVYLLMQDIGAFNIEIFTLVTAATVILGLSALGEPVIGGLAQSPAFPLLAIGGLIVAWRAVSKWRSGDSGTQTVVVREGGGSE